MINRVIRHIPSQKVLEKRFSFIKNPILKTNLAIAFRYIIFLISLESEATLPGVISYSLYKDIILYTAAIVESCIHHCLKECIDCGEIKSSDVMPYEWKDSECSELYKISEDRRVCGVIRYRKSERFSTQTQFKTLNEVALRAKIFNRTLFDKVERLRKKRNRVHLAALKKVDDFYEKKDVQNAFDIAKVIIEKVEIKLGELK